MAAVRDVASLPLSLQTIAALRSNGFETCDQLAGLRPHELSEGASLERKHLSMIDCCRSNRCGHQDGIRCNPIGLALQVSDRIFCR